MVFKINIGTKEGKTYKVESDSEAFIDKSLGETIKGEEFDDKLSGLEFEIAGASDKAGFPSLKQVDGFTRKRVLLGYGIGMHKRPKGDKKKNKAPPGLRLRKTARGKIISSEVVQINLKLTKEGSKKISEIFATPVEAPAA